MAGGVAARVAMERPAEGFEAFEGFEANGRLERP